MPGVHTHPLGVNMVVNFFAATVFTLLMCAFWWVVGSREISAAVQRKADILYTARKKLDDEPLLRDLATMMDVRVNELHKQLEVSAKQNEAYRQFQNKQLMLMWMSPIITLYLGLFLAAVAYNQTRTYIANDPRSLSFGHWCALVLVFFSYIPEILFFLFVIEWKVPIGDYEMGLRMCGFL
jgi:hypothetical protein